MAIIEKRLNELGITLPPPYTPVANYVSVKKCGNVLYISGTGPIIEGRAVYTGKVGVDISKEEGYQAARITALNILSTLKHELGDLDRVESIISVQGFVSCNDCFFEHPYVINGASDLLVEVFGEAGKHARIALGANVLPFNIPVEILMIVQIKEQL